MIDETQYEEESQLAKDAQAWRSNLEYWKRNFPGAFLNLDQNRHLEARVLRTPWDAEKMGLAPLVNVEIIPKNKPLPKPGFLAKNSWVGSIASAAAGTIPVVGAYAAVVVAAGFVVATAVEMKKWSDAMSAIPPEVFSPQYYPKPFTVPLPLDRAQKLVRQPWLASLMVQQFFSEFASGRIQAFDVAYKKLTEGPQLESSLPSQSQTGGGSVANVGTFIVTTNPTSQLKWSIVGGIAVSVGVVVYLRRKQRR